MKGANHSAYTRSNRGYLKPKVEPAEGLEEVLGRTIRWVNSNAGMLGVVAYREVLARLTMERERARAKAMAVK